MVTELKNAECSHLVQVDLECCCPCTLSYSQSLTLFIVVLGRKVCRVRSSQYTTEVPSVTMPEESEHRICIKFCEKAWWYLHSNLCKVAEYVWRGVYEPDTSVWVVQMFLRWITKCWQWLMFWETCNQQNRWNHHKCVQLFRNTIESPCPSCWRMWTLVTVYFSPFSLEIFVSDVSVDQKEIRVSAAQDPLVSRKTNAFWKLITGDKSWVYDLFSLTTMVFFIWVCSTWSDNNCILQELHVWWVVTPPWQYTCPFSAACTIVFGKAQHSPSSTTTIFSRPHSLVTFFSFQKSNHAPEWIKDSLVYPPKKYSFT